MVLGVGLGRVSSTGRWSEFSQLLIFPPKISIVSHNFRQLQLWTGGEGYAGWSSANRCLESKAKLSKSFPDLQNGRHGLVGADCRFLVGRGLGRVDGISIKRNPYFLEVDKCHQTSSFPQHDHHQIVAFSFSRQQIPSKSSLFLVRVGYCGVLHGTFASSSQTTTASTPTVKRKIKSDYFWLPGIFSRLLSRLNYDEEEMMANMGGSRLYRSVWFKTSFCQWMATILT